MRWWRIAPARFALDRSGTGAALSSARWNPRGMPAIYCASSISLAALEKFVNGGASSLPMLVLVAVDLPDDAPMFAPPLTDLPVGWRILNSPVAAQEFGRQFLSEANAMAMRVPSVLIPEEDNLVINPAHPRSADICIAVVRHFEFDVRMFKG